MGDSPWFGGIIFPKNIPREDQFNTPPPGSFREITDTNLNRKRLIMALIIPLLFRFNLFRSSNYGTSEKTLLVHIHIDANVVFWRKTRMAVVNDHTKLHHYLIVMNNINLQANRATLFSNS